MTSAGTIALLVAAGLLAGTVGTAGAITSLVSYPALLAVGTGAHAADVANIVAVTATWPGSAIASRRELRGRGRWLARAAPAAMLGGAAGVVALLVTPAAAFSRIVPFLVALGSLALLLTPRLSALRGRRPGDRHRGDRHRDPAPDTWIGIAAISTYNGYFGAGSGVMLLALCLVAVDDALPVANALKNTLVGIAAVVSAIALVIAGHVEWARVVPLAAGMFAGATIGPAVARRAPERALRIAVACVGLGLAVELAISSFA